MSLDYADYEWITRRRKPLLALVWQAGDKLYYTGLLGGVFMLTASPFWILHRYINGQHIDFHRLGFAWLTTFWLFLFMFLAARPLKRFACVRAGISK
ncbi:MAG TPA: hypothetical protein VFB21_03715 [Chthonomonadaceae bacterium]|nr:hypothetical protein [Chthonomonadaceae bacterium]